MNLNSPIFDKIRSRKKSTPSSDAPPCQHENCSGKGIFKAPKGHGQEGEFYLFCLEHVKIYNQTYNYFSGMTDAAVQRYQKDSATGHRPTWKPEIDLGGKSYKKAESGSSLKDRLERIRRMREQASQEARPRFLSPVTQKALHTLGLDETADKATIRLQFKRLAKRLHPDLNQGDRSREDELREIIAAYTYLKRAGLA